ncbi:MAG: DUF6788 family protein [Streptosporangiaceae bacterium]
MDRGCGPARGLRDRRDRYPGRHLLRGKPNCACAQAGHPGHGPQCNLTRSENGKTVARHLRPGPELDKVRREVGAYERFRDLVGQVTEVNEAICEVRPASPPGAADDDSRLLTSAVPSIAVRSPE